MKKNSFAAVVALVMLAAGAQGAMAQGTTAGKTAPGEVAAKGALDVSGKISGETEREIIGITGKSELNSGKPVVETGLYQTLNASDPSDSAKLLGQKAETRITECGGRKDSSCDAINFLTGNDKGSVGGGSIHGATGGSPLVKNNPLSDSDGSYILRVQGENANPAKTLAGNLGMFPTRPKTSCVASVTTTGTGVRNESCEVFGASKINSCTDTSDVSVERLPSKYSCDPYKAFLSKEFPGGLNVKGHTGISYTTKYDLSFIPFSDIRDSRDGVVLYQEDANGYNYKIFAKFERYPPANPAGRYEWTMGLSYFRYPLSGVGRSFLGGSHIGFATDYGAGSKTGYTDEEVINGGFRSKVSVSVGTIGGINYHAPGTPVKLTPNGVPYIEGDPAIISSSLSKFGMSGGGTYINLNPVLPLIRCDMNIGSTDCLNSKIDATNPVPMKLVRVPTVEVVDVLNTGYRNQGVDTIGDFLGDRYTCGPVELIESGEHVFNEGLVKFEIKERVCSPVSCEAVMESKAGCTKELQEGRDVYNCAKSPEGAFEAIFGKGKFSSGIETIPGGKVVTKQTVSTQACDMLLRDAGPDCKTKITMCDSAPRVINGITVTPADFPALGAIGGCWTRQRDVSCSGTVLNQCEEIEKDATCKLTKENCEETDRSGNCMSTMKYFSCGTPIQIDTGGKTCNAQPYCISGVCFDISRPEDGDFARVIASMETVNEAANYNDAGLNLFKGTYDKCISKAWGATNCCKAAKPSSAKNFVVGAVATAGAYYLGSKFASDAASPVWSFGGVLYHALADAVSAAASTAAGIVSSAAGAAAGSVAAEASADVAADAAFNTAQQAAQATATSAAQAGAAATTTAIAGAGTGATAAATTYTGSAYGVSISYSSTAGFKFVGFDPVSFMTSVAVTLIVKELMSCPADSQQTAQKKAMGLCIETGSKKSGAFGYKKTFSHCCFNSVLAKTIYKGGKEQLGLDIKTCGEGLTQEQLTSIDMSKIDFSEFMASVLENVGGNTDVNSLQSKAAIAMNSKMTQFAQPDSALGTVAPSTGAEIPLATYKEGTSKTLGPGEIDRPAGYTDYKTYNKKYNPAIY